ncbi:MAG: hypothetical protein MRY49_03085 [Candidatus Pacebacteria bacterium]|nr:hypothetical protein [Candidatus Paceibacterota bacterium]
MKTHKSKIQINVILYTILALVITLNIVLLWYLKDKVEDASLHLNTAETSYEERDRVRNLSRTFDEIKPQIEKIDSYFVGSDDVVGFINLLEREARNNNLSTETTNVSVEESAVYGDTLIVSITTTGSWNSIMRFVKIVETLPHNISIRSSSFEYGENEEGAFWRNDMTISVIKHK